MAAISMTFDLHCKAIAAFNTFHIFDLFEDILVVEHQGSASCPLFPLCMSACIATKLPHLYYTGTHQ